MMQDWETFRSLAKQTALTIRYHFGKEASSYDETIKKAPTKVHISWKRPGEKESIWGVDLTKNELMDWVSKLKEEGIPIPVEVDRALIEFPTD